MLDMGGNSGYAAGLTSPKNAARFSFNEHGSHAASADASDASWQIAEVLPNTDALQLHTSMMYLSLNVFKFGRRGMELPDLW